MVGRSSCGGRVSVIFPVKPDQQPIRADTRMGLTNEDPVYSTVTCTVLYSRAQYEAEKCNGMFYTRTRRPEEDFHQESRSLPVIMFGWSYKKYSVDFPSAALCPDLLLAHNTVP